MSRYLRHGRLAKPRLWGYPSGPLRAPVHPATSGITLGPVGRCPGKRTLAIKVFDDSGSILAGNDTTARRYEEAILAIDAVSRRCRCDNELVAILHMDRPNSADVPPTPLNPRRGGRFGTGLRVPPDGDGASTLRATLRRAEALAIGHPEHEATLAVFSDFLLFDDNLPGLWAELGGFPAHVVAVALRAAPPQAVVDDDRVTVVEVGPGSPAGSVARALFGALTTHRRPGAPPVHRDGR
jgi:hypothetical protein